MILLYIFLLIILIYFIFFVSQFYNIILRGYAPFISTGGETIKKIISKIEINNQSTIYELGCGQARFLQQIEKEFSQANLIGIENIFSIYLVSKLKLKLQKSKIKILKKDFFKFDLKNADIIYCYLNTSTMVGLGKKIKKECKLGTQIISRSFPITEFEPEKVISVRNKKIYFYEI